MPTLLKSFIPKRISNKAVLTVYDLFRKLSRISDRMIASHRKVNRAILSETSKSPLKGTSGFIENQSEWSDVQIGCGKNATMRKSGCGIFAIYNALYALKRETNVETILELIARFEKSGLALKGRLGVSPKAIYEYFEETGFDVHMTISRKIEDINKIGKDYEVTIVTAYNDKSDITQQIHTVCITKNIQGEYFAHNAFFRKDNRYVAMPTGTRGFATLHEVVERLTKKPQVISVIGVNTKAVCG